MIQTCTRLQCIQMLNIWAGLHSFKTFSHKVDSHWSNMGCPQTDFQVFSFAGGTTSLNKAQSFNFYLSHFGSYMLSRVVMWVVCLLRSGAWCRTRVYTTCRRTVRRSTPSSGALPDRAPTTRMHHLYSPGTHNLQWVAIIGVITSNVWQIVVYHTCVTFLMQIQWSFSGDFLNYFLYR